MTPPASPNPARMEERLAALLEKALLLDLEVSQRGRILRVGAVLGPSTLAPTAGSSLAAALDALSDLARSAECVVGHNLIRHDLRVLREAAGQHPLLRLPVIDTLVLSPIAFPENPYHRLVKDYKLVRESVNDPVADARQAGALFADEFRSLDGLRQTEPGLFELLHYLMVTPGEEEDALARGMAMVFRSLGGNMPSRDQALHLARAWFGERGCRHVPWDASLLQTGAQRWAVAYASVWLRVAGSNSVLPPWVRLEHPEAGKLIERWRDVPCGRSDCEYCRRTHDPREQLRAFFGFEDFRAQPANARGESLQRDIIEAGLRDESLLAILPTGGGKSLCYQLPALTRNFRRGVLTLVISPLQALMKDQVDGLARRTGTPFAAALYGLLTPPERGDVLRRIRLGDVALLYVSPEQLRNRSFRDAIAQREVGCWVFDEAHCLSKWGHDFRPDYLYAGRFIREFSQARGVPIPTIACFTATAKREVKEEIVAYFKSETGRELALYEGGVERDNLRFEVQTVAGPGKWERMHELLSDRLPEGESGSAIIFRATREATEASAKYLQSKGWKAAHFHAGLTPPEKKRIQDEFLAGDLRVICATNAFGMGIDKEDVRLVIHADTPGSLENYLQEAGRAGRDGQTAECVLLYDESDCEHQFRMGAFSELSRRDIAQILRSLRRSARGGREKLVITSGEILRDEQIETDMQLHDPNADTKVRTAISWLERAGLLQRDENVTRVFQARLLVRNLPEAEVKMASLNLSETERDLWLALLRELMNAGPADNLTVDGLALLPELTRYAQTGPGAQASPEYVGALILKILAGMDRAGLLKRDTLLNAYVRHKVADHSRLRLDRVLDLDRRLLDILAQEEPDPEGWLPLSLTLVNERLIEEGGASSNELVRALLKSLSEDGRGFAGTHGSIDLRYISRDSYRVRVRRSWAAIGQLAQKRRQVASLVLDVLLHKIPDATPPQADRLVEFSFEELRNAVERDRLLRFELKDVEAALERALMYLHEQRVILLQQGLAVFRSAMTLRLPPEAKGVKYTAGHYQPLRHHYQERVLQVHVMSEFARRGLERIREALGLVLAYFTLEKEAFLRRYFGAKPDLLKHATTARSYQRIVTNLENPAQIKVVTAPAHRNLLVLAGPGSGKTKTLVHRCAYLLRVERVRPQSVLVCCFNRQAALSLRRRLAELVGEDARGVTVLTYHGLAFRLLGRSWSGRTDRPGQEPDFDALITNAIRLLRGDTVPAGLEPDEVRDRLLAGYEHILVDEYQDIDEPQYEMISALAGRTLDDPELKLSLMAVGDDDQNIYAFRGANVEFIRRFQHDYEAEVHYLVENYRSTRLIIEAANQLIEANRDRMKTGQPIRIDRQRDWLAAGGDFERRDERSRGRVQVICVRDAAGQARAVLAEIRRLRELGVTDWQRLAVLSSTHRDLARVRTLAEREGIPIRWWAGRERLPPLHQVREIRRFLEREAARRSAFKRASDLKKTATEMFGHQGSNPWIRFLHQMLDAWETESQDAELPVQEALEFVYESCAESRREFSLGEGLTLGTVHAAKGAEFDHVLLIGPWPLKPDRTRQEEARRAFYVGMTRARQTLAVFDRFDVQPSLPGALTGSAIFRPEVDGLAEADEAMVEELNYTLLGLEDVHLGYPGHFKADHPVHGALARLEPGDNLTMRRMNGNGIGLLDQQGVCVARLSRKGAEAWMGRLDSVREVRLLGLVHRGADLDADPTRSQRYLVSDWEIPLVEIVSAGSVEI
jgi:ATP-dependent DNA helicase RecQ